MTSDDFRVLNRLVGFRLFSVQFGLDHLQLRFETDGNPHLPVLSCDVMPTLDRDGVVLRSPEPGYADGLTALIGQGLSTVAESPETGLVLRFGTDTVVLNPSRDELFGEEIALLSGFDDGGSGLWVAGEEPFEHLV